MDNEIENLAAEGLLQFFVEEVGPIIYNKAVADVQSRLQARVAELDVEISRGRVRLLAELPAPLIRT